MHREAGRHEVHKVLGARGGFGQPRGRLGADHEHRPGGRDVVVGRLAVRHLDAGDAQRPDVRRGVVGLALDHLGRHPVGRADLRVPARPGILQLAANAEVG